MENFIAKNAVSKRIEMYIKSLNFLPNKYAVTLKIDPTMVYNIIGRRKSKPSFDLLCKMLSFDKTLNVDWILLGDGEMIKQTANIALKIENDTLKRENELLKEMVSILKQKQNIT